MPRGLSILTGANGTNGSNNRTLNPLQRIHNAILGNRTLSLGRPNGSLIGSIRGGLRRPTNFTLPTPQNRTGILRRITILG
ncbi:unnamed protein product [Cyprideis torosa]|uniref:Uncharacterized protein n=1 Tax=Cyprideis torosa TaxID=163714 RepID=A0A7R8WNW5_9CRUS|nr:unnamed protein product [Cyprideis torosa]CAG0900070.1 unnamed protein product [Cyprideis torosa]